MFKSLDSIASVVGIVMYLTISKFKQVLRSWKGLGKVSTTTLLYWVTHSDSPDDRLECVLYGKLMPRVRCLMKCWLICRCMLSHA